MRGRVEYKVFFLLFDFSLHWSMPHFYLLLFIYSFRAVPSAHGSSQARGQTGATAAGLHHSHISAGSEPSLQPTSQLMAKLDPGPTEQGQGSNPHPMDTSQIHFHCATTGTPMPHF